MRPRADIRVRTFPLHIVCCVVDDAGHGSPDRNAGAIGGRTINPTELLSAARVVGLKPAELRAVMYHLPLSASASGSRQIDPCPMSAREVEVLRRLAQRMLYKQIAVELGVATSTVRAHLHNV